MKSICLVASSYLTLLKLAHRPGSNLTGHFASMSVCAPHTTLTLTGMKWISTYLRLKKLKLRPLFLWGYVLLYYMVFIQYVHGPVSVTGVVPVEEAVCRNGSFRNFLFFQTKANLVTPRNGEPLIAAIQDFLTGQRSYVWQLFLYDMSSGAWSCTRSIIYSYRDISMCRSFITLKKILI